MQNIKKFIWFLLIFSFLLLFYSIYKLNADLQKTAARIIEDLEYNNGKWDVTPYVNERERFSNDIVYIFNQDGFVIERNNTIKGFLDYSDYRFNSSFKKPQTIVSATGERWRLLSKTIEKNSIIKGAVLVGYRQPETGNQLNNDLLLEQSLEKIMQSVTVEDNEIKIINLEQRNISSKINYQITNKNNQSLLLEGRVPTFIDSSYVSKYLEQRYEFINTPPDFYFLKTFPLETEERIFGLLIIGKNLSDNALLIVSFGLIVLSASTRLAILLKNFFLQNKKLDKSKKKQKENNNDDQNKDKHFSFDAENSRLYYGNEFLEIPYDSNQYYVCKALFSQKDRRWEYDQLIEVVIGKSESLEVKKHWRKIYDAVRIINQKAEEKFAKEPIIFESKTFKVND